MLGRSAGPGPLDAWCPHCRDRWGPEPGGWGPQAAGCAGWAAAAYRGPVRRSILAAKRGAPTAAAQLLVARCPAAILGRGNVVTWVPAHPRRALLTPDSGSVLAEALAQRLDLSAVALLHRSPLSRRQAGRAPEARRAAPERLGLRVAGGQAVARRRLEGARVILVDDVRTTGTTLDQAAWLLSRAGAAEVLAFVVAAVRSELDA